VTILLRPGRAPVTKHVSPLSRGPFQADFHAPVSLAPSTSANNPARSTDALPTGSSHEPSHDKPPQPRSHSSLWPLLLTAKPPAPPAPRPANRAAAKVSGSTRPRCRRHRQIALLDSLRRLAKLMPSSPNPRPQQPPRLLTSRKTTFPGREDERDPCPDRLKHLDSKDFRHQNAAERKKEIDDIVAAVNNILPGSMTRNPHALTAPALITKRHSQPRHILDYWATKNPKTPGALNPIRPDPSTKIYERAHHRDQEQGWTPSSPPSPTPTTRRVDPVAGLDDLQHVAEYNRANAAYGLALPYDKADPKRAENRQAKPSKCSRQFHRPRAATSASRPSSRTAKLNMLVGRDAGLPGRKENFQKVSTAQEATIPNSSSYDQLPGPLFHSSPNLLNKKLEKTSRPPSIDLKDLAGLKSFPPTRPPARANRRRRLQCSEYPSTPPRATRRTDAVEKTKFNAAAVASSWTSVNQRPDLRPIISSRSWASSPTTPSSNR